MARGKDKDQSVKKPPSKAKRKVDKSAPIQTNIDTQDKDHWLSENILNRVSDKLGIPRTQISNIPETIRQVVQELGNTERIIDKHNSDKSALIQILLEIQRENRWLPKSSLKVVSEKLGVPLSQVYRVATFYKAFSLVPQGRHLVTVCLGTACHIRGAPLLLDKVVTTLSIQPGETSSDQRFTLETVNCLGCCALGPVMVVDGEYHSNPASKDLEEIVAACK
jgi:NADH-quinone oxidoreductase subunit E